MDKQEQIIQDRFQKLTERMKELGYNSYMVGRAKERIDELQQRGVRGVDKFVQKLLDRVNDKQAYLDILIEGRFAIILARNSFSGIHIEYTDKGADLKAIWNRNIVYFEITRRHSEIDEWADQPEAAFVVSPDRIENIIGKIQEKLKQLQNGEINVVVIWSDKIGLLPSIMEEAFKYIEQEVEGDPQKYKKLSGVLFTEGGGVDTATLKQFYLFKNDKASKVLKLSLVEKLESLLEQDKVQLQEEIKEMTAALKSLR